MCSIRRKVGIVFALPEEEAGFRRVMSESRSSMLKDRMVESWNLGSLQIMVCVSGPGRKHCESATRELLKKEVQCIICAGFAAGLDPLANVGDVFVASKVLLHGDDNSECYAATGSLSSLAPSHAGKFDIRHCDLVTTDHVLFSSTEKQAVYRVTGAGALDMESYAAAEVCHRHRVPFTAIRAISDTAHQELPEEMSSLMLLRDNHSRILFAAIRPRIWMPMLRLQRQARLAAENLGDVLGIMILRMI